MTLYDLELNRAIKRVKKGRRDQKRRILRGQFKPRTRVNKIHDYLFRTNISSRDLALPFHVSRNKDISTTCTVT